MKVFTHAGKGGQHTSNSGLKELREEITHYLSAFELEYDPIHEVRDRRRRLEGIDVALHSRSGDEVLIPQPAYVSYLPCVVLADGVPVTIELQEESVPPDKEELLAHITDKTEGARAASVPNNPTGGVMRRVQILGNRRRSVLRRIFLYCPMRFYSELTYVEHHVSIASIPGMQGGH